MDWYFNQRSYDVGRAFSALGWSVQDRVAHLIVDGEHRAVATWSSGERVSISAGGGDANITRDIDIDADIPRFVRQLVCDVTDKLNAVRGVQSGTRLTPLPNDGWRATNARPFEPTVPTADAETFAEIVKAQDEAIARLILGPLDESAKREALDALRALSADHVAATPPRRHNAHCPRCYGPAYQGLGAVKCEREGGCLATREPRVSPLDHDDGSYDITHSSIVVKHGPAGEFDCEPGYFTADDGPYATRDLAVAAWRETVLARAKREAGL